ncbi:MAG: ABC transporter permease [Caldiserica bacterium]|jgi:simple sugar transport system permease protein|nr:ABC transporter permease [Caldisericota bacterium]MDH7563185.1 ABC transporter permease [Caldisericota bacterium]
MSFVLEKRERSSPLVNFLVPTLSIVLALLLGALIIYLSGFSPKEAYLEMFNGSFGSGYAFSETIVKAIPLMLCALGVGFAFRTVLWNIGAEGQLYMGAWAAGWIALNFPQGQSWWLIPSMMVAGFLAGAFWGLIPGILKASLNVNEIITSLLLNYVAILWVDYFVYGPWKDPKGYGFPFSPFFGEGAWLPTFFGTRIHLGLVFALLAALLIFFLLRSTRLGFEVRVIGENPQAARYAGMNIFRTVILVFMISGGLAGLAGMAEVSGVIHRMQHAISPGYGYTAIIIAWLSRLNPLVTVVVSILFGGLLVGGFSVRSLGLSESLVYVIQGIILFLLLAGDILTRYRLSWRKG